MKLAGAWMMFIGVCLFATLIAILIPKDQVEIDTAEVKLVNMSNGYVKLVGGETLRGVTQISDFDSQKLRLVVYRYPLVLFYVLGILAVLSFFPGLYLVI